MKSYAKILSALSATVLTVPLLVSFGSAANAATAPQSLPPEVCNSIDLTGTWVPNYVVNKIINVYEPIGNTNANLSKNWYTMQNPYYTNDYRTADRIQITQSGCKLAVLDVKNGESWYVDMSGRSLMFLPLTLAARLGAHDGHNQLFNKILDSLTVETVSHISGGLGGRQDLQGMAVHALARIPETAEFPFAVAVEADYNLVFSPDYSSPDYQRTGRFTTPTSISTIELRPSPDVLTSKPPYIPLPNFRVLSVNSPLLPGPLAKAFVSGANWLINSMYRIAQFPFELMPRDYTHWTHNGGTTGDDGLTIVKVSNKLI